MRLRYRLYGRIRQLMFRPLLLVKVGEDFKPKGSDSTSLFHCLTNQKNNEYGRRLYERRVP